MPDNGRFEARTPADWNTAFAALPEATPPDHGWRRLQARLPAATPAHRPHWPWGMAIAASLLLAAFLPWRLLAPTQQPPAASATSVAARPIIEQPDPASKTPDAAIATTDPTPAPMPTLFAHGTRAPSSLTRTARVATRDRPAGRATATPETAAADPAAALDALYARSAQLEDLLALARDDRVATGAASALTDVLEAQLATVDAALSQPDLSASQRATLWGSRVDALQQLAGIATTQRLYAARGQSYDAALVTID